eukprot:7937998-Pyramimonas_sp.AAC.1
MGARQLVGGSWQRAESARSSRARRCQLVCAHPVGDQAAGSRPRRCRLELAFGKLIAGLASACPDRYLFCFVAARSA